MAEDLNLDRELARLRAIEPSPEFAAKVRARIAEEPARSTSWWWVLAALPAAAAVALAVSFATRDVPDVPAPAPVHADVHLPLDSREVATPADSADAAKPVRTHAHREPRQRTHEPEILIDPALAAAVRRLIREQPTLPEMPPEPTLDSVVVEPLKVPDISSGGITQGDRQ
jgi:hypothetical protein